MTVLYQDHCTASYQYNMTVSTVTTHTACVRIIITGLLLQL